MTFRLMMLLAGLFLFVSTSNTAEYNGQNIDGVEHDATAYSYDTGKYYNVTVAFSGDEATITFTNGHSIDLTLDDEEIEDPHSIDAFDYKTSVYWELDVEGLD